MTNFDDLSNQLINNTDHDYSDMLFDKYDCNLGQAQLPPRKRDLNVGRVERSDATERIVAGIGAATLDLGEKLDRLETVTFGLSQAVLSIGEQGITAHEMLREVQKQMSEK